MQKKLLLLSFMEGAAVMAAELCGAKLLAPIFGSSLYVWASVMGITLAALASGYFFGGWLSSKTENQQKKLFLILNAAALFLLLLPVLSYYMVPRISYLPFLPGVVLSTFVVLFFPVFFLGASSPLFIALQTAGNADAGKVSGTVYAVSTTGGILATFLCGFYLIPQAGLSACLLCFGGLLFAVNFIVFKIVKPFHILLFAGFIYLNYQFSVKKSGQLLVSDSLLGHMEVEDFESGSYRAGTSQAKKRTVRILRVNNIIQSEMDIASGRSVSEYVKLFDTLVPFSAAPKNALVLGLGGGLVANLLVEKNYTTDGVELDNRIIDAARKYFYLDEKVNTMLVDARYFLNGCTKKYDLILADVFRAEEQPSHIFTSESLEKIKENLKAGAVILINWHGYVSGNKGLGTAVLYNTLTSAGFDVKLCSALSNENYRNIIFVASLNKLQPLPFELNENLALTSRINTDNLPLLERYNAEANKAWRANYLRYYQGSGN